VRKFCSVFCCISFILFFAFRLVCVILYIFIFIQFNSPGPSSARRWWSHKTDDERILELLQREQQPGESADKYIHSMQQIASRLKKPMPERHLVRVANKGLRDRIARYVYAVEVITVDELREECVEVEQSFGWRGRDSYGEQGRMRVSEVHREQELWEHGALIPWLHRGKEVAVLLSVWTTGHGVSGFNPRTGGICQVLRSNRGEGIN